MVQGQTGGAAVHPARQAHAERIYGTTQQVLQGRCARCLLVQRPAPSQDADPKMDGGLQYKAPPFIHRGYAAQGIQEPFRGRILPRNEQH